MLTPALDDFHRIIKDENGDTVKELNPKLRDQFGMKVVSEASYWIARRRYRKEFHLSAAEMDAEPLLEFEINGHLLYLDGERAKLDNADAERQAAFAKEKQARGR